MAAPRIFVTRPIPDASLARLARALPQARVDASTEDLNLTRPELLARARGADALLCTLADPI
ncbi:MAG TPA: D-glycerate dehydrogenase, partial [Myxococcota bacterium]|nr:D-glycerate dehydrogenase [Myxococcota bacterium]